MTVGPVHPPRPDEEIVTLRTQLAEAERCIAAVRDARRIKMWTAVGAALNGYNPDTPAVVSPAAPPETSQEEGAPGDWVRAEFVGQIRYGEGGDWRIDSDVCGDDTWVHESALSRPAPVPAEETTMNDDRTHCPRCAGVAPFDTSAALREIHYREHVAAVPSPAAPTGHRVAHLPAPAAPTEPAAEEMVSVRRPWIDHDGGRPISFDLREAADRVEAMRIWGSNKTAGIARLLRDVADACAVRAVVSDTEQGDAK